MFHRRVNRPARRHRTARGDGVHVTLEALIALRNEAHGVIPAAHRPVGSVLAGQHLSRFRGRGMDYQESRIYQAGDDIRNMDWRVTARAGRPHVKLYQEERERPVVVLVDFSPTLFFATRGVFKSVVAARAAAFLAWAAVGNGDRIGALLVNGGHRELQPTGGDQGALRLIRALVEVADPDKGLSREMQPDGFNEALRRLRRVARPGSLIFILSDFYGLDEASVMLLGQLRRHSEVAACQILDVLERVPPPPGQYPVTDGKQRGILDTRDREARRAYEEVLAAHQGELETALRAQAIPLVSLDTAADTVTELRRFLQVRGRRRRRGRAA